MNRIDHGATLPGVKDVLSLLHSLQVGELGRLQAELDRAGQMLADLGATELEQRIREAQASLRQGDMKEFRRSLATVTARLGHLK